MHMCNIKKKNVFDKLKYNSVSIDEDSLIIEKLLKKKIN